MLKLAYSKPNVFIQQNSYFNPCFILRQNICHYYMQMYNSAMKSLVSNNFTQSPPDKGMNSYSGPATIIRVFTLAHKCTRRFHDESLLRSILYLTSSFQWSLYSRFCYPVNES